MNLIGFVDSVARDLRYALRGLLRRPSFAVAAVLTLALGIGATTAIFSVVYSVLIKPLPYPDADELVRIKPAAPGLDTDDLGSDVTMLLTYRSESTTLAEVGLWDRRSATLTENGEAERVPAVRVTDGTLEALGVKPMLGRWFTEEETFGPPAAGMQSVILSYAFWQRRFGGDEAIVGRELAMEAPSNSTSFPFAGQWRVVGVMPQGFRFLDLASQPDVIIPLRLDPANESISNFSLAMVARVKPGVTPTDARADVERMRPIWLDRWPSPISPEALASFRITSSVSPLKDDLVGTVASSLWVSWVRSARCC